MIFSFICRNMFAFVNFGGKLCNTRNVFSGIAVKRIFFIVFWYIIENK